jgi:hypothetical protein
MSKHRTSRSFTRSTDTDLGRFTGGVIVGFTANPVYPDPPVATTALGTLKDTFDDLIVKASRGGSLATAQKNTGRALLLDALNKDASYVDINCNDDLATLLTSGYLAASTNRAQRMLNPPQILAVENPQSGQLKPRVSADSSTRSYVGRIKPLGGEYGPAISFASSRKILFDGLTAGVSYVFQLMAIGGSTGQSDWSDPGTGMAQ